MKGDSILRRTWIVDFSVPIEKEIIKKLKIQDSCWRVCKKKYT